MRILVYGVEFEGQWTGVVVDMWCEMVTLESERGTEAVGINT